MEDKNINIEKLNDNENIYIKNHNSFLYKIKKNHLFIIIICILLISFLIIINFVSNKDKKEIEKK